MVKRARFDGDAFYAALDGERGHVPSSGVRESVILLDTSGGQRTGPGA